MSRPRSILSVATVASAAIGLCIAASSARAQTCEPPPAVACEGSLDEFGLCCDEDPCTNPCWDPETLQDRCEHRRPPPPGTGTPGDVGLTFHADMHARDGALAISSPVMNCSTVSADKTGYYALYSRHPVAESCVNQRNETTYFTVSNGCNEPGHAVERNVALAYVIFDGDNTKECTCEGGCSCGTLGDDSCTADCDPGFACLDDMPREVGCCVRNEPTYLGTFLFVAGEPNTFCIHYWCNYWEEGIAEGMDLGFIDPEGLASETQCNRSQSVHLDLDWLIAVPDTRTLHRCDGGCDGGECLPDPCDTMSCPAFCYDGECVEENPCARRDCGYGCKDGRCLHPPTIGGEDGDGDGYPYLADCDDGDPDISPGCDEECDDGVDNDCDGRIDEGCAGEEDRDGGRSGLDGSAPLDGGSARLDGGPSRSGGSYTGGGGCAATGAGAEKAPAVAGVGVILLAIRRLRRLP